MGAVAKAMAFAMVRGSAVRVNTHPTVQCNIVWAGTGEALPRPRPLETDQAETARHTMTEAGACPGEREAPADGGAGAGRAFEARPVRVATVARWRRRWPSPSKRQMVRVNTRPTRATIGATSPGREMARHCLAPARWRRVNRSWHGTQCQRPAPAPAGEKRPPGAGRALAGPLRPDLAGGTLGAWRRRWPSPWRAGGACEHAPYSPSGSA